jgi:isoprenylcysteine carboxyl methyltransferase (ICMT) family protein YpbQ
MAVIFEIINVKLSLESALSKKKIGWGTVLGALLLIASCVAAYNITKPLEKNVSLPIMQIHTA